MFWSPLLFIICFATPSIYRITTYLRAKIRPIIIIIFFEKRKKRKEGEEEEGEGGGGKSGGQGQGAIEEGEGFEEGGRGRRGVVNINHELQ